METETPRIAETIALAEKKVAMALDDLIKLSKRNTNVNNRRKSRGGKNKNQNSNGIARNNTSKVRHYVSSLSAVRQGAVAKKGSNFQGKQFPVTTNSACKAVPPLSVRGRAFSAGRMTSSNQPRLIAPQVHNRSVHARFITKRHERKTLDSRFAIMKEQRNSNNGYGAGVQFRRLPPWITARGFDRLKNKK